MISATTAKNIDRCITTIDPTDTVNLHSFSGRREPVLCIGSTTQQIISEATDGSLSVNVFKAYMLHSDGGDIDIMATDDLVIAGGSIHFGTNERTVVTQVVAGQQLQYDFSDGRSHIISASGGATALLTVKKLNYIMEYTVDLGDQRRHELAEIAGDVAYAYQVVAQEEMLKSYTIALEMAIGKRQQDFAVSTLRSHANLPLFPPCLTHFDSFRTQDSVHNPVQDLLDAYARVLLCVKTARTSR
jgi:hypothetical protein